jgi:O-antigen/teichoic acid export membrane protein
MHRLAEILKRCVPDPGLLRSSGIVLAGDATARLLGFAFAVAAARLLTPAGYGQIAYALAATAIVSVLTNNAPVGLGRFLARHQGDRARQDVYATNWLTTIALLLAASALLVIPVASWAGLGGAMLIALWSNLLGTAVFQTYRETQKGLGRFWVTGIFWVLSNLLQLAVILTVAALGFRSPALFLTVYGLSAVAVLLLMYPVAPAALSFKRSLVSTVQVIAIARFIWPVILTGIFYNAWLGADLILLQRLLSHPAIGSYAAAKTLNLGLMLPVQALVYALGPRMARITEAALRGYIQRVLALAGAVILPLGAGLALLGQPLIALIFGGRYAVGSRVVIILATGQALFGLYTVLQGVWIWGLGRPRIDAVASGAGMVTTIVLGLLLIPGAGLVGAAAAYTAGAAAQLLVVGTFTAVTIYAGARPRLGPAHELILELDQVARA